MILISYIGVELGALLICLGRSKQSFESNKAVCMLRRVVDRSGAFFLRTVTPARAPDMNHIHRQLRERNELVIAGSSRMSKLVQMRTS